MSELEIFNGLTKWYIVYDGFYDNVQYGLCRDSISTGREFIELFDTEQLLIDALALFNIEYNN